MNTMQIAIGGRLFRLASLSRNQIEFVIETTSGVYFSMWNYSSIVFDHKFERAEVVHLPKMLAKLGGNVQL